MVIVKAEGNMSKIQKADSDNAATHSAITEFIFSHFPLAQKRQLRSTDPLIESGVIDSMGMLDVVAFIEEEFRVKVEDEDLSPENFHCISTIAAFVEMKKQEIR
jgi:acyl carrier protein